MPDKNKTAVLLAQDRDRQGCSNWYGLCDHDNTSLLSSLSWTVRKWGVLLQSPTTPSWLLV